MKTQDIVQINLIIAKSVFCFTGVHGINIDFFNLKNL